MRLRCHLFGCEFPPDAPGCCHCGEGWYDGAIHEGLIYRARCWLSWKRRRITFARCDECKALLWPLRFGSKRGDVQFCSKECEDSWIPF